MYWSSGALEATSTASEAVCLRPARPARCQVEAIVPGYPAMTTASSPPISIPNSSALVATTARISPSRSLRSISRRSRGRYPPRYPRTASRRESALLAGVLEIGDQDFGRQPAVGENQRLLPPFDELQRDPPRLV